MKSNSETNVNISVDYFNILCIAAFRYALGRRTYVTSTVSELIRHHVKDLETRFRDLMIAEIDWAIQAGEAGDQCDIDNWTDLRKKLILYNLTTLQGS